MSFLQILLFIQSVSIIGAVNLTTKQNLLMNQILQTYVITNSKNQQCVNDSEKFKNGLRNFDTWALNSQIFFKFC